MSELPRLVYVTTTSLLTRGAGPTWVRIRRRLRRVPASERFRAWVPTPAAIESLSVPFTETPATSIIVPVFNHWDATLICLQALASGPVGPPTEVILIDDGSTDPTRLQAPAIDGLRYHRRPNNAGFIAACADGARLARGEYLVFLNNDTVPQPNWLDRLISTFVEHPRAGLVGAQLLGADGTVQEAGGVVFSDGSAANYGRSRAPDHPRYSFVREVDYCSGAAIAVPRALFEDLGGFDSRYSPAYYEDTDLAFKVRSAGHSVLYQPASRVLHYEGTTSGTDLMSGVKAYQVRNRAVFADKWREVLAGHADPNTDIDAAAVFRRSPTVLVIDGDTPQSDRDSGSVRLIGLMSMLRELGAHVVFWPMDRHYEGEATEVLQQLGIEAWYAPYAMSLNGWLKAHGQRFDTVLACRYHIADIALPLVRRFAPQATFVFDTVDLHHVRERRLAEDSNNQRLLQKSERTRRLEVGVAARSDLTLVVSDVEERMLRNDVAEARIEILSNIHNVVPNPVGFAERRDVVFVGGFRHEPNISAVVWFAREVWPRVTAELPQCIFHCIGGSPPAEVIALEDILGVRIHGHVRDLTPYMDGALISVAPLRSGAGVKGKVNMSMAHGQPVVATSTGIEGMHLTDGVDVLVADGAQEFANAVICLHQDESLWTTLAANGRKNVEEHFSPQANLDALRRVLLRPAKSD